MYARVVTAWVFPDKYDELARIIGEQVTPLLKQEHGFYSVQLLTEPQRGKCLFVTLYESEADVTASDPPTWFDLVRAANIVSGSQELNTYEVRIPG